MSSDGLTLYTYVTTQGYTQAPPMPGVYHTPYANDELDDSFGAVLAKNGAVGPDVCPSCQAYVQTGLTFSLPYSTNTPSLDFRERSDGEVFCSSLNGYLWSNFEIMHTFSIRLSAYIFNGLSSGRCTWVPTCAGACSSQYTTNTFDGICYTTGPYRQCFDLLKDGKCWVYRAFCYGKAAPGICSN